MTATDIPGFRKQMMESISSFYARRGLEGSNLYRFSLKLQKQANLMHGNKASKADIKVALAKMQAGLLRFPHTFLTTPRRDKSFMTLHMSGNEVEIRNSDGTVAMGRELVPDAKRLLLNGSVANEGHYAGMGTRLESSKPKFEMTPADLVKGLKSFAEKANDEKNKDDDLFIKLTEQLKDGGGIAEVEGKFLGLKSWKMGQRIFLAKLFELAQIGREYKMTDEQISKAIRKLKFKIIVNQDSGEQIEKTFVENRFFGFDPLNMIFMSQAKHPTYRVKANGELAPDEKAQSQGNHGLIPFQSALEDQWKRFVPSDSAGEYSVETLSARDYREFQGGIDMVVVESVEDRAQLVRPYDYPYLGLVHKLGAGSGYNFFMQLVGQKTENPQKGGFLADVQPEGLAGSNHTIESNRAPEVAPRDIVMLNRNRNVIYNPNLADDILFRGRMIDDLHPTFEPFGANMELRIDPKVPNGDRNIWLLTGFLSFAEPVRIENLKDSVDIIPTLSTMAMMDSNPELIKFARAFLKLE